jgi:hypothetical protein
VDVPPIYGSSSDDPGEVECRQVRGSWREMEMTWNNQPSVGPAEDVITGIEAKGRYSCEITSMFQEWVDGERPNHGIALFSDTELGVGMNSFEAGGSAPKNLLVVTFADDPQACPEPAAAAAAALAALGLVAARRRR